MPTFENPLPDVVIGRHPDFGIIATNPTDLDASDWTLPLHQFYPRWDHPDLYVLADQQRDGRARAAHTVDVLRRAGFHVEADIEFDSAPAAPDPEPATLTEHTEPDIAFAEHPRLGIIAATTDGSVLGRQLFEEHGWLHNPSLDIYTLPPLPHRDDTLAKVARVFTAMRRVDLHVAMQPALARTVTERLSGAPSAAPPRQKSPDEAPHRSPATDAAADRAGLPVVKPPTPAAAAAPPAGPADPRGASPRTR
jgi:hypothetical protein